MFEAWEVGFQSKDRFKVKIDIESILFEEGFTDLSVEIDEPEIKISFDHPVSSDEKAVISHILKKLKWELNMVFESEERVKVRIKINPFINGGFGSTVNMKFTYQEL
jgi:hypothetical protein